MMNTMKSSHDKGINSDRVTVKESKKKCLTEPRIIYVFHLFVVLTFYLFNFCPKLQRDAVILIDCVSGDTSRPPLELMKNAEEPPI